jgi:type II secretory pathway pseudopilin PulG
MIKLSTRQAGFTLLELIIVLLCVIILASLVLFFR